MNESRNTSFIFYSNIFDYARGEKQWGENYNISTNYLIQNDKNDGIEMKYYDRDISEVSVFRYKEIKRQIDFVCYYKGSIKFKLPDKVAISINNLMLRRAILKNRVDATSKYNYNDFIDGDETKYDEYYPLIKYVYKQLNALKLHSKDSVVRLKCDWHMAIFNAFFHNYNLILNPPVNLYDILTEFGIINNSERNSYFNAKDFEDANIIEKVMIFLKSYYSPMQAERLIMLYNGLKVLLKQ